MRKAHVIVYCPRYLKQASWQTGKALLVSAAITDLCQRSWLAR
jgi:hypothetical protein